MKSLKKFFALCLTLALVLSLAACAQKPAETTDPAETPDTPAQEVEAPVTARIAALKGPTAMGLVKLMSDAPSSANGPLYDFTLAGSADEVTPALIKGELDMACVPANLAAVLYNKTEGAVQVLAVNTLGVLYIVENGDTVQSVADLKGQTIVTTGKGTTPEYVLRYVLSQNGIDPDKDVTIEYLSEATEVAARLTAPSTDSRTIVAMLPQPFVTSVVAQSEGGVRVALDMNEEWQKVAGSRLVTGVTVVRKEFAEANPDVMAQLMTDYAASVESVTADLSGTAALCEQYGVVAKAALAEKALPSCNIVFETGDEMKTDLETYFNVLYAADPTSVGGQLPADDFYYAG